MNLRFPPRAIPSPAVRSGRSATTQTARRRWRFWTPERLEERALLATFTVTDLSGDPKDAGSLPHAVGQANAAPGSTIVFQPGLAGTIPLTASLNLRTAMTITGPGASLLAVQGGGAQANFSAVNVTGGATATLSGLTITGGNAGGTPGGGIDVGPQSTLMLTGSTITNCTAAAGGGVFDFGNITMINCAVSGNRASNGGGIAIGSGATMAMTGCTVVGNTIDAQGIEGGGIDNRGTLTLTNCTVAGNSANNKGGGIGNFGTLTVINSTVAGNSGTTGGGIFGFANFGPTMLINSTVAGNSASSGGGGLAIQKGVVQNFKVTLHRSIVANNSLGASPSGPASDIAGTVDPASSFNIIGPGGSGGLVNGVNHNIVIAARHRGRAGASPHVGGR
jgi:hypothetical protein